MLSRFLLFFVTLCFSLLFLAGSAEAKIINIPITEDTYIQLLDAEENRSGNPELFVGYSRDNCHFSPWDSSPQTCPSYRSRALLKIPLEHIPDHIESEEIISARIFLFQFGMRSWIDFSILAYPISEEWDTSAVTWMNHPDYGAALSGNPVTRAAGWQVIDITHWVKEKMTTPETNFGILLRGIHENSTASYFWSSECLTGNNDYSCDPKQQPFISIVHTSEVQDEPDQKDDSESETDTPQSDTDPLSENDRLSEIVRAYNIGHDNNETKDESGVIRKLFPEVKGVMSETSDVSYPDIPHITQCTVVLKVNSGTYAVKNCTPPAPRIGSVINHGESGQNVYKFSLYGSIQSVIRVKVDHIYCTPRTFWQPITWFKCIEETRKTTYHTVIMRNKLVPLLHGSKGILRAINPTGMKSNFILNVKSYFDPENRNVYLVNEQSGYLKVSDMWLYLRIHSNKSNVVTIPKSPPKPSKPFSYFFKSLIGVTQWHGYTAYQKPHTGIDFGSYNENVYAPADGTIAFAGWDSYYGQCLSGGNILIIQHAQDYHTAYFHLKDLSREDGSRWNIGDSIKKNQYIATTGNTGAWNCQPLGYHLHFELRKNRAQSSHINPVPYIDVDWNRIPTIGWRQYPGRLTGDNPHPTF